MNTVQTSLTKIYCNDLQAIMGVCVKLITVLYYEIINITIKIINLYYKNINIIETY